MDVPSTTISARSALTLARQLLVKAPRLRLIEPTWVRGRRAMVEPARLLPAAELEERVCAYFACHPEDHLIAQSAA